MVEKEGDKSFKPKIWEEDDLPSEGEAYGECEICTGKSRIVWGEGNPEAPVVIVLDNPGAREDKEGRGYVCGTRETLQRSLYNTGLSSEDFYLTYLLKCRPLKKYDKEQVRTFSMLYLIEQINKIKPKIIVCLGDVVVQTMFEDKDISVKNLRGIIHEVTGYPCIVSYHPLAVRRRPNLMKSFMDDWGMLARLKYKMGF